MLFVCILLVCLGVNRSFFGDFAVFGYCFAVRCGRVNDIFGFALVRFCRARSMARVMEQRVLSFVQVLSARTFAICNCCGEEWRQHVPLHTGSRRASLHHDASDCDHVVQFPDGQYTLRGGDLLAVVGLRFRFESNQTVKHVDVQKDKSIVKFECMSCDMSLLVCGATLHCDAVGSTELQEFLCEDLLEARTPIFHSVHVDAAYLWCKGCRQTCLRQVEKCTCGFLVLICWLTKRNNIVLQKRQHGLILFSTVAVSVP